MAKKIANGNCFYLDLRHELNNDRDLKEFL